MLKNWQNLNLILNYVSKLNKILYFWFCYSKWNGLECVCVNFQLFKHCHYGNNYVLVFGTIECVINTRYAIQMQTKMIKTEKENKKKKIRLKLKSLTPLVRMSTTHLCDIWFPILCLQWKRENRLPFSYIFGGRNQLPIF